MFIGVSKFGAKLLAGISKIEGLPQRCLVNIPPKRVVDIGKSCKNDFEKMEKVVKMPSKKWKKL